MCRILCYTGMRISEMLAVKLGDLDLDGRTIYLPKTKNNEARSVYLTAELVEALRAQPPRKARPRSDGTQRLARGVAGQSRRDAGLPFLERGDEARLFRFSQGGKLRKMLSLAMRRARLVFPVRQGGFHIFCHTYGSWMSRYGDLDTFALTRTERWKDPRSADRYRHTHVSEEARRADWLPTQQRMAENRGKSGECDTAPEKQKRKQRTA
jgi:integrase